MLNKGTRKNTIEAECLKGPNSKNRPGNFHVFHTSQFQTTLLILGPSTHFSDNKKKT